MPDVITSTTIYIPGGPSALSANNVDRGGDDIFATVTSISGNIIIPQNIVEVRLPNRR